MQHKLVFLVLMLRVLPPGNLSSAMTLMFMSNCCIEVSPCSMRAGKSLKGGGGDECDTKCHGFRQCLQVNNDCRDITI